MKFNKKLTGVINKYSKHIHPEYWFDYKRLKKILNETYRLLHTLKSREAPNDTSEDICCICLEPDNLMPTFCCHNSIHHVCLVKVLCSFVASCPMCRASIEKALVFHNDREYYDTRILTLISVIQLNINKVENIYKQNCIPDKYLRKYCYYNYIAVIKISKKIDKYLHSNIKGHFTEVIKNTNIFKELQEDDTKRHRCFDCLFCCEKNKSIF
jgi:hypothetical protein